MSHSPYSGENHAMDNELAPRATDVLKTIAYFDVFKYPLTDEQIYRFLPRNSVTSEYISNVVRRLVDSGVLAQYNSYYFLHSEDNEIVARRKQDEHRAGKMLRYARTIASFLKQFPFTRGVFITGTLSKNIAAPDSDIDFMIVTAQHRLWICKAMLTAFRKIFLLGSNKYFCTNLYMAEHEYELPDHNLYAAVELFTTKVAWNAQGFNEFQQANAWASEFLPNCSPAIDPALLLAPSRSPLQRLIERCLSLFPLDAIDRLLMNTFHRHWSRRRDISEAQRSANFHTSPSMATVWKTDYQTLILRRYKETLSRLGVEEIYD